MLPGCRDSSWSRLRKKARLLKKQLPLPGTPRLLRPRWERREAMRGLRREALWRRTGCTAAAGREKAGRSTAGGASPCVAICALSAALACSAAHNMGHSLNRQQVRSWQPAWEQLTSPADGQTGIGKVSQLGLSGIDVRHRTHLLQPAWVAGL